MVDTPNTQTLLTVLSTTVLQIVLPLALTAITAYGLKVLHRLQKKYGVQLEEADQSKVDRIVSDAIRSAEEFFAGKMKANPTTPVTAADKHAMAANQVMDRTNLSYGAASNAIQ